MAFTTNFSHVASPHLCDVMSQKPLAFGNHIPKDYVTNWSQVVPLGFANVVFKKFDNKMGIYKMTRDTKIEFLYMQ